MAEATGKIPFRQEIAFDYGVAREVAPGVRRLVANNPGPFTYKGTNCYILGQGEVGVVDPGPEDEAHLETLLDVLGGERVSHIILTHTHRDHSGCLERLKAATGAQTVGYGPTGGARGSGDTNPGESDFVDTDFRPDMVMREGDIVEGSGWALQAVHTPGHAPDHLCFDLVGSAVLFSGDHVMSWNTSVIAPPEGHMGDYLNSLEKLMGGERETFLPGHGGRIEQPQRVVKAFLVHRSWREAAILESIKSGNSTIPEIVDTVYRDLDPKMAKAASFSVLAHAVFLVERGKLSCCDGGVPSLLSSFSLL